MTRRMLYAALALGLLAREVHAVDPGTRLSQYAHSAWRVQDGAFGGAPQGVSQTTDGFLWVGTNAGLFRFDGVRFVPFTPPEPLPSLAIISLLGARDGSLWIGTELGLSRWKDRHLTSYPAAPGRINA